ncbi:Putative flippase GtrA (transmembrane translocase of bactoprenol-linked glucose) [Rhizobium aethiopicum]|uniref:Putative flippase GtrA (Transmembrane translocase of bactoprenol-linked glucose) n=1 Tax=Rhizobium aethiopicum TaxID=1138170 RepID=A0A1C3Y171_9HYPH|nr:GtrA family protein [Rhizobium aethiopicum]SCB58106.1 Putative flippase GtrA (transmembrane translocase of bactoprenol-linked glucose) [Rhizobium aethiopicum]
MILSKAIRYVFTGGLAAFVDLTVFRGLLALDVPLAVSATSSWLVAAAVNYSVTSRYVFNQAISRKRASLFLIGALLGLSINVCVTLILAQQVGLSPLWAKFFGIGTAFTFNFLINLLWVFR